MTSCVFPGSFDPVTLGHMDLIRRAAMLFDRVTVTVMVNIHKQGALTPEKRVELLQRACAALDNVEVDRWSGLLAEYVREKGAGCVIRGVRSNAEYEAELTAASVNRLLNPKMETLLMPATDALSCVSSSAVREIAAFGGDIRSLVPEETAEEIAGLLRRHEGFR